MLDPAETSLADTVQSQEHPEHETQFSSPTLLKEGADHVAEVLMKAVEPEQKQELELSPRASPQKRSAAAGGTDASQCQAPAKRIRGKQACDFPSHPCTLTENGVATPAQRFQMPAKGECFILSLLTHLLGPQVTGPICSTFLQSRLRIHIGGWAGNRSLRGSSPSAE
jgi:hypothetical protein